MATEIETLNAELDKRDAKMQALLEALDGQVKTTGAQGAETLNELKALVETSSKLQARLLDLEQKAEDSLRSMRAVNFNPSISGQAVDSDAFKAVLAGKAPSGRVDIAGSWWGGTSAVSTITSNTTGDGAAGDLIVTQRLAGIVAAPERQMTIRDLLMPGSTSSNSVEYIKETGFTNSADLVTEGGVKPQSDITFDIETANVVTIAHWVKATRQILSDVPMLRSYIDGRLRYGLRYKEETELLNGSGVGLHFSGLKTEATAYNRAVTGDTKIDALRRAITQVQLAEYRASAIIIHPADWEDIELLKDGEERYLWANPRGLAGPTMWGLPIVATQAQTEGEFTVGAFNMAAQIFDRESVTVELATQHASDFTSNLVTILAEERLTMIVSRPEAIVDGAY